MGVGERLGSLRPCYRFPIGMDLAGEHTRPDFFLPLDLAMSVALLLHQKKKGARTLRGMVPRYERPTWG